MTSARRGGTSSSPIMGGLARTKRSVRRRSHLFGRWLRDRKSTRLNSSHANISYAVFCLKKKDATPEVPSHLFHVRGLAGVNRTATPRHYAQPPTRGVVAQRDHTSDLHRAGARIGAVAHS